MIYNALHLTSWEIYGSTVYLHKQGFRVNNKLCSSIGLTHEAPYTKFRETLQTVHSACESPSISRTITFPRITGRVRVQLRQ